MVEATIERPTRRTVQWTGILTVGYLFASLPWGGGIHVVGGVNVHPEAAYPLVGGLLFGPAGAFGSAFGVLLTHVSRGGFGLASPIISLGFLVEAFVAYALWGHIGVLSTGDSPSNRTFPQMLEFTVVALVASLGGTAVTAWGLDLLGLFPFYVTAQSVIDTFVSAVVLGMPALYLVQRAVPDRDVVGPVTDEPSVVESKSGSIGSDRKLVVVLLAWFGFGVAASLGTDVFGAISQPSIAKHIDETVASGQALLVLAAHLAQGLVGMAALTLLIRYCLDASAETAAT